MKKYNIKRFNRRTRTRGGAGTETKASLLSELSRLHACNGNPYMIFDVQQMYMTESEMKKRYRAVVLKYHPDKNKGNLELATEITKIWNNAKTYIEDNLENPPSNDNENQGHAQHQQEAYAREQQRQQQEAYARAQQQQKQEAHARAEAEKRERVRVEKEKGKEKERIEALRIKAQKEREKEKEKEKERIEALRVKA